ncbi:MAG: SufE family protein [Candidatus Shikimatogenerans bostrichidophilus]|nr:MAG: SufE family protein [Candidatus Shikimatogenerans bostrichidophilus]
MFYKKVLKKIKGKNFYKFLFSLSNKLPKFPNKYKKNKYLLKECLSNTWIFITLKKNKIKFIGFSESNIINGLIYLIIKVYSNKSPYRILKKNIFKYFKFNKILSINRYISILNIIKYIKIYTLKLIKKYKYKY